MVKKCPKGHYITFKTCLVCKAEESKEIRIPWKAKVTPEQLAFEKYFSDDGQCLAKVEKHRDGTYKQTTTYRAWVVWQARANLGVAHVEA